jgi:integrase
MISHATCISLRGLFPSHCADTALSPSPQFKPGKSGLLADSTRQWLTPPESTCISECGHGADTIPYMTTGRRLTDQAVRQLPPPAKGNRIAYDNDVPGFGCRVTAAGAKSWILNYRRKADGVERRYTIGSWPSWSVVGAREEAKRLRRAVDGGGDPVGEAQAMRDAPTLADLAERFLAEHVARRRPSTQLAYRIVLRKYIVPALGRKKVAAVEPENIERLHALVSRQHPTQANRVLAVTAAMFQRAVKWKLRPDNPCKGVERNREHARRRYLRPDELTRLSAALAKDRNQRAANVFRLLLLTGARRSEVLFATWPQFDLAAGTWTKPAHATKQNREHTIPLSAPARQLLQRMHDQRHSDSPWLFPGRNGKKPRQDTGYAWARVLAAAGIHGLRIHDLRHSYASALVNAGFSLPVIARLLGHSQVTTTARYSHLYDDVERQATERVGAIIAGKSPAPVVPLKGTRRGS